MSVFLGNASQYSHVTVDEEKIKLAEIQFTAMSLTFNKVLQECRQKCIPSEYGEGELNTGEQCCLDRCVSKYVKANTIIGMHIQSQGFDPFNNMPEYKKIQSMVNSKSDS